MCCVLCCVLCAVQGDSGFVVVRQGQIVLRSSPKQHFFDCPLQFGSYPEHVDDTDTADDAEIYQLPVLPGDVIIAGVCVWFIHMRGSGVGWGGKINPLQGGGEVQGTDHCRCVCFKQHRMICCRA